jgi:hypothetical protein
VGRSALSTRCCPKRDRRQRRHGNRARNRYMHVRRRWALLRRAWAYGHRFTMAQAKTWLRCPRRYARAEKQARRMVSAAKDVILHIIVIIGVAARHTCRWNFAATD